MDTSIKRVFAYIIDILLVTLIVTLLTNNDTINPYFEKYNAEYEAYYDLVTDYQDEKISKEDYEKQAITYSYNLEKYNVVTTGVTIASLILYFGFYQAFMDGQTLGKRLFKLRLVNKENEKLGWGWTILRSVILNNIVFRLMLVVGVYLMSAKMFHTYSYVISMIEGLVESVIFVMVILRQDGRGLHDMLVGSKVINLNAAVDFKEEMPKEETKAEIKTIEAQEKPAKETKKAAPKKTAAKKTSAAKKPTTKKTTKKATKNTKA